MVANPLYYLSSHAYACEVDGHAIFLDLRRDKYTAIAPEDLTTLRACVQGWLPMGDARSASADTLVTTAHTGEAELIAGLRREGLITDDAARGRMATLPCLAEPQNTVLGQQRPWPVLNVARVRQFVSAWLTTTMMLKALPIRTIVERVRRRKERGAPGALPFDAARAAQLAVVHAVLQPVFYSARDACLRNSLTLIEFLARSDLYPDWVFGVRMNPFAAHSWVQQGHVLLNDDVMYVKSFTPLLTI